MPIVKYGEWEIDVDIEATKYYYYYFTAQKADSQSYRNYFEHCKNLTEQENAFFQSLGMKPECCDVGASILYIDNKYPACGSYCFAGKILKKPAETFMTTEELAEKNYVWDLPDTRIYIDRYIFTFIDPNSKLRQTPLFLESMPEGFIGLDFSIENISWLLDEKYKGRIIDPSKFHYLPKPPSLIGKANIQVRMSKDRKRLRKSLIEMFNRCNTNYTVMSSESVVNYMNTWFEEIVPKHNQEEARNHCFTDDEVNKYLWHAFGYGSAPCIDGFDAGAEFENIKRGEAVLIMNNAKVMGFAEGQITENAQIGYIIENAANITAKDIDAYKDIIITGKDFEWCYVHTHEAYCGPYFYQKNKTFLKLNEEAKVRIWADDNSAYFEIFEDIRRKYGAVFYKRDYDNFGNPFYRGVYLDERIVGHTVDKTIEKAKSLFGKL